MSEEAAFIAALTADHADDVTRAVYADWLEERGDARAAFLRAEIALAMRPDGDQGWCDAAAAVPRDGIDDAWASAVGPSYDVWLMGYDPTHKIQCIKVIREQTGLGLREAKGVSEALPAPIVGPLPSWPALRTAVELFKAARRPGSVVVRRAGHPTPDQHPGWPTKLTPPSPPGPTSLWLVAYPPANKIALIKLLREHSQLGLTACKTLVERSLPVCLHANRWSDQIERLQAAYALWATVEVRSGGTAGPAPAS